MKYKTLEQQLQANTDKSGGPDACWICTTKVVQNRGECGKYAVVKVGGRSTYAHRLAYVLAYGAIPEGREVCHSCDNPRCVNPAHLRADTHEENMADRLVKNRGAVPVRHAAEIIGVFRATRGHVNVTKLARVFGTDVKTVKRIATSETWGAAVARYAAGERHPIPERAERRSAERSGRWIEGGEYAQHEGV